MSKEEDMQRTLCAEFPGFAAEYDGVARALVQVYGGYTSLGADVFYAQTDIDLSGYAMERKTFYPYSSFEQRSGATFSETIASPTTQPYIVENTIVSSVPLNETELSIFGAANLSPGFSTTFGFGGRFDRTVIIHGDAKLYTLDSTISISGQSDAFRLIDRQAYSSLEPTAADKLYCYRIVYLSATDGEMANASVPDSRVLIPGTLSTEPKLEYMMRLKRSYELANQV
jgi:hypothetical protein